MVLSFPRVECSDQIAQVERLANEIWREHYRGIVDLAQIDYMLERLQSHQAIAEQINEQGYRYHLIEQGQDACGYLAFYPREQGLFLSKIYLRCALHGRGLGWRAVQFVQEQARGLGLEHVWLTVNRHNRQAIQAYQRWGFEQVAEVVQEIGNGFVMDDYRMEWWFSAG